MNKIAIHNKLNKNFKNCTSKLTLNIRLTECVCVCVCVFVCVCTQ